MRLDIRPTGYRSAAAVLLDANQALAMSYDSFVTALHGYGAMAGSDVCGEQFAGEYDVAAAAAVGAYADLVSAFGTLSSLTAASLANHRRADAASVIGGSTVYGGDELPSGTVTVQLATPPSALGGDGWGPWWWDKIADHVGALFPDADCDRLRAAAELWWHHADTIGRLVDHCDRAAAAYRTQTSPEVSAAVAAFEGLAVQVREISDVLRGIGDACSAYASAVDETREAVLRAGAEFIAWTIGIQAAGAVASAFTLGTAQGPTQLAQAAKLAMLVAKIRKLLAALSLRVVLVIGPVTTYTRTATAASTVIRARYHGNVIRVGLSGSGRKGWADARTLLRHFRDHGHDFSAKSPEEYARIAREFWVLAKTKGLPTKVGSDGTTRIYDIVTNTFASFTRDGLAKTIFKPTAGLRYWNRQPGVLQ